MKEISIIGTVGIPACYGGFETLVENLTNCSSEEFKYSVYCSSKAYSEQAKNHNGAKLIYLPLNANGVQSVLYDIASLSKCLLTKPDVVLILGVSGCVFLPFFRLFSKAKVVTNIDGLEWRRDKWNTLAKKFLKFSEYIAVKYSDVVIADNQAIGDYIDHEYNKDNIVIAYGGDHVIPSQVNEFKSEDYYISICRIEPENNVDLILDAFSRTTEKLKFVGNWDSSEYGKALKSKYSSFQNIEIIDPVYDIEQLFILRSGCKGYLHGHSAGGTNPSLVEAMHFSKPIYAFDCDFNRYTTDGEAFYFSSSDDLNNLIVSKNNDSKMSVGKIMKKIALKRYTWKVVANQYESLF
ncbi:DUF1972 domain-containing protein [Photobacterium ganghwense]|uniref:DUF1972 domain-containing protein n=1 Tax=Photobacterium ganghwense TaxID=320778 RepID=UPI0040572710